MPKRCQTGSVKLRNGRWVGRYYVDDPDNPSAKRSRLAIVLGMKDEMTKPEAKRKMLEIIAKEEVNTPACLERALGTSTTFNHIADAWETKRLPQLKPSSQYSDPGLIARHLRSFFGPMPIESIRTGTINNWVALMVGKKLKPKTVRNMWKKFRAIANWHYQQEDQPPRSWKPTLPVEEEKEQRWFTQDEIRRIVEAAEGKYKVLFHLAGATGMRAGEMFGLRGYRPGAAFTQSHTLGMAWQGWIDENQERLPRGLHRSRDGKGCQGSSWRSDNRPTLGQSQRWAT
jgi:hypothetical protein